MSLVVDIIFYPSLVLNYRVLSPTSGMWVKGLGLFLYRIRYPLYKFLQSDSYKTQEEHILHLTTEVHNQQPGDSIEVKLYETVLSELGFDYKVCPHNHFIGRDVLDGVVGQPPLRFGLDNGFLESSQELETRDSPSCPLHINH